MVLTLDETGFDVTCIVGRVEFDSTGDHTPFEAAMLLIAERDMDGTFVFPSAQGGTTYVTIEYSND